VKVLLDENFPLGLLHRLRAQGIDADHVITLKWRGASDRELRKRVPQEEILFLTQDREFLTTNTEPFGIVLVSRVRQARPLADRIAIWDRAIRQLLARATSERLFELSDDGQLLPWSGRLP
jgi:hypothetical protein